MQEVKEEKAAPMDSEYPLAALRNDAQLVLKLLPVLPHSSASVERIFSLVNHIKTKSNSPNTNAVEESLLANQGMYLWKLFGLRPIARS